MKNTVFFLAAILSLASSVFAQETKSEMGREQISLMGAFVIDSKDYQGLGANFSYRNKLWKNFDFNGNFFFTQLTDFNLAKRAKIKSINDSWLYSTRSGLNDPRSYPMPFENPESNPVIVLDEMASSAVAVSLNFGPSYNIIRKNRHRFSAGLNIGATYLSRSDSHGIYRINTTTGYEGFGIVYYYERAIAITWGPKLEYNWRFSKKWALGAEAMFLDYIGAQNRSYVMGLKISRIIE